MATSAIVRSGPNTPTDRTPERSPPRTPGTPTTGRTYSAGSRKGVHSSGGVRLRPEGSLSRPVSRSGESQGRPGSRSGESWGRPGSPGERFPSGGRISSGGGRRGSSGISSGLEEQDKEEGFGGDGRMVGSSQPPDVFVLDEEEEETDEGGGGLSVQEIMSPYVRHYGREYSTGNQARSLFPTLKSPGLKCRRFAPQKNARKQSHF